MGWVAFEPASGNFGTRDFEAGHTPQEVTHDPYTISFRKPFVNPPRFFARMATYAGTDSSQVRTDGAPSANEVAVHVEEEECTDAEMNHVEEIIDYVAFEAGENQGVMYGVSNLQQGCEGIHDATKAQLAGGAVFDSHGIGSPANAAITGRCTVGEDIIAAATNGAACDAAGGTWTTVTGADSQSSAGTIGTGFIDFVRDEGETATWNIMRCMEGHYTIAIGYALGSGDRPMSVTVNDQIVDGYLAMPATGSWGTYREVRVAARMKGGLNTITLSTLGFSGPDVDYISLIPIGSHAFGDTVTIGESGVIDTLDYHDLPSGDPEEQWQQIELAETLIDPVVFIGVPTSTGGAPAVARLKDIRFSNPHQESYVGADGGFDRGDDDGCASHCFRVRLQEPPCTDDVHKREEISYLVMEAGAWYSDQGKLFQVGRVQTAGANGASWGVGAQQNAAVAGGWTPVTYHTPFADDMVSALTQVQTYVRE